MATKTDTSNLSAEDRKMLNSIFLRSFTVFASCAGGSVKAGADGWLYSIQPALDRYYKDRPDDRKDAMKRHTTWYNITQNVGTFAMGLVASMERENSTHSDFDTESIDAIKVSLMGPMSGIGDAIFWGVLRVIAAGIGINIAMTGSPLGAIVFLLIYNIPSILCRYYMTYLGYNLGTSFITQLYDGGLMKLITKATSTVGLIMVGAMTAANVVFNSPLSIPVQDSDPVLVQTYLDAIFKGIVPLTITLVCLHLLKKNVNVNLILFGLMVFAFVLGLIGVM
jgi:PTS system mannose-specific IID component